MADKAICLRSRGVVLPIIQKDARAGRKAEPFARKMEDGRIGLGQLLVP